jgi:hypothetical protein
MALSPNVPLVIGALCLVGAGGLAVWSTATHRRAGSAGLSPEARTELRALIREELSSSKGWSVSADASAADASTQPLEPLDGAQKVAYDEGTKLVGAAIGRKSWTDDDAQKLRDLVAILPAARRMKVVESLVVAINNGSVRFDGKGPPL